MNSPRTTLITDVAPRPPSFAPIVAASAFCSVVSALYVIAGVTPAPLVALGILFLPLFAAGWWIRSDAAARRFQLIHDWGFFGWLAWPLLLPLYAWKTRGWRGWRLAVGLLAAVLAPYVVGVIAYGLLQAAERPPRTSRSATIERVGQRRDVTTRIDGRLCCVRAVLT